MELSCGRRGEIYCIYHMHVRAHTHCCTSVCPHPLLPNQNLHPAKPSSSDLIYAKYPSCSQGLSSRLTLIPHPLLSTHPPPRGGLQGLFSSATRESKMAKKCVSCSGCRAGGRDEIQAVCFPSSGMDELFLCVWSSQTRSLSLRVGTRAVIPAGGPMAG